MLIGDGHNRDKIQLLKNRAQNISNGLLNKTTEEGKLHFASELWVCLPHTYWPHAYLFFPHSSTDHVLHWLRRSWVDICVGGTEGPRDLSISKPVNQLPLMNSPEVVASVTWTSDPLSIPCFPFSHFLSPVLPWWRNLQSLLQLMMYAQSHTGDTFGLPLLCERVTKTWVDGIAHTTTGDTGSARFSPPLERNRCHRFHAVCATLWLTLVEIPKKQFVGLERWWKLKKKEGFEIDRVSD